MKLIEHGVYIEDGKPVEKEGNSSEGRKLTIAHRILSSHSTGKDDILHIRFDSLTSHDITYVGIIQTARASGMHKFPVPYVLTNCHNTLCAVGGTINEDDHAFALSACKKYGGIYVPPCLAVIHSYNREMMTGCGRMILGSDSHTRYGALGTMGIGEGGGEIAKQLLGKTYDIQEPEVVLVYMTGKPKPGVGPHDVALAICAATYDNGFVKNRVMEFTGPGIASLSQDYRNGIDVMTTETTCLSSIWETDEVTREYFVQHNRPEAYTQLSMEDGAYYDRCMMIDLSTIEPMIALPMHPSKAMTIRLFKQDPKRYLKEAEERIQQSTGRMMNLVDKVDEEGNVHVDQAVIAGCAGGTYENIVAATDILHDKTTGNDTFRLSVYPDSLPVYKALTENGTVAQLLSSGAIFREAFCGPCFGAGDTPADGELSIRHTTRNFPNREGSKPGEGQMAAVCLMDARSIAATSANHGVLTGADEVVQEETEVKTYAFDASIYANRVFNGYGKADERVELKMGPNIKDWPDMPALQENLLLKVVSHIDDPVTTTDELIPSGETSSYRSNPLRLAEFTLSRRDPDYVKEAKAVQALQATDEEVRQVIEHLEKAGIETGDFMIASCIYANKPGDGSAREQAASCQRVLGAGANIAHDYATKRYRSNLINWGMIPFVTEKGETFTKGTWVFVKGVRKSIEDGTPFETYVIKDNVVKPCLLSVAELTAKEKEILLAGSLINANRNEMTKDHSEE